MKEDLADLEEDQQDLEDLHDLEVEDLQHDLETHQHQ